MLKIFELEDWLNSFCKEECTVTATEIREKAISKQVFGSRALQKYTVSEEYDDDGEYDITTTWFDSDCWKINENIYVVDWVTDFYDFSVPDVLTTLKYSSFYPKNFAIRRMFIHNNSVLAEKHVFFVDENEKNSSRFCSRVENAETILPPEEYRNIYSEKFGKSWTAPFIDMTCPRFGDENLNRVLSQVFRNPDPTISGIAMVDIPVETV